MSGRRSYAVPGLPEGVTAIAHGDRAPTERELKSVGRIARAAIRQLRRSPPDRIVVGVCDNGHLDCAVLPGSTRMLVEHCGECDAPVRRVRYQLVARRGQR